MTSYGYSSYRWLLVTCFAFLIAACEKEPELDLLLENDMYMELIGEETGRLIARKLFSYDVEDFTRVEEGMQEYKTEGVRLLRSDTAGFQWIASPICSGQSPASCGTMGPAEHFRVNRQARLLFDRPGTVLGMHLSLDREQAELLELLEPQQGTDIFLLLPQFRVLISGLGRNGEVLSTIRTIPASATYAETVVEEEWHWIPTALLGEVWGLHITVESPVEGTASILIDNLTLSGDFQPSDEFFSIALIPDTQKYAEFPEYHDIFYSQTEFLAGSVEEWNLVFTSHLGDLVENGDLEPEWVVADRAMSSLDGILPYGVVIGNHDFQDEWNNPQLGSPLFLKYFPESRFNNYSWWGGRSPDELSSYQLFETDLGAFLYLHLTVDSPPPTVTWAQQVLDDHPDIPSLVTTHAYLRENGRIPVPYLSGLGGSVPWEGISADELFETLIAPNDQVFMVTCGHISAEHLQISLNETGNEVYELLQDYQNRESGGEGFLRLMQFYPGHNRVQMVTYSPWLDTYEMDEDSYFALDIDFKERF